MDMQGKTVSVTARLYRTLKGTPAKPGPLISTAE
jgi:hypothetical protein